jgi:hypothetical protein
MARTTTLNPAGEGMQKHPLSDEVGRVVTLALDLAPPVSAHDQADTNEATIKGGHTTGIDVLQPRDSAEQVLVHVEHDQ